uniref:Thioredoxin-disufide reductase n=1 Tax=Nephromyces sp. MMRI TaxID=2496275 RepID=A0A3Q8UBX7_9APIC|nr:thioredoxin-disufide reductase [Nephromyces sp. MMRI]
MRHFDYFVIGGGSGGIASARRAASYGKKVGIAEKKYWGGTCVNFGCVPKKIMWNVASMSESLSHCKHFGFENKGEINFSWNTVKTCRDAYIKRLNKIYKQNLKNAQITFFDEYASFDEYDSLYDKDGYTIKLSDEEGDIHYVTATHVLIASGGKPSLLNVPGEEYTINSDGFFKLKSQPKKVALIGSGYISVELAGVLNSLGTETHMFVRGNMALRKFDSLLKEELDQFMKNQGIKIHPYSIIKKIEKNFESNESTIFLKNGKIHSDFDCIIVAIGRDPEISFNIEKVGIKKLQDTNFIKVDEYQNTSVENIYALGDVCGLIELTPMAIAAGRRLADRLFGGILSAKVSYDNVPTVIFSHPPIGFYN